MSSSKSVARMSGSNKKERRQQIAECFE